MAAYYSWQMVLENPLLLNCFIVASLFALVVIFFDSKRGKCKSSARLEGKTVIVTGCTAGIGEQTAYSIASRGAKVILACRNVKKGNIVKDDIIKRTNNSEIFVKELDVSLLSSVRRFAEDFINTQDRLDVLIHNAGVVLAEPPTTEESLNTVWATNYFGPFLLTNLLLDVMKKTGRGRIIFVSSMVHTSGEIKQNQEDFFRECKTGQTGFLNGFKNYCDSKLAEILFTKELARRLPDKEVTVNSLHPGLVKTSILSSRKQSYIEAIIIKLSLPLSYFFTKTAEEGAQTSIYLAVSEEVEGVTGKYFSDCKEKSASALSDDQYLAKKLWGFSEDIVGMCSQTQGTIVPSSG